MVMVMVMVLGLGLECHNGHGAVVGGREGEVLWVKGVFEYSSSPKLWLTGKIKGDTHYVCQNESC